MKRIFTPLVTAVIAAAAVGLLAPRRLVSQYATPVNVMNSKSAPAQIRDTDNPRRTPYASSLAFPSPFQCNPACPFTAVPNNMRLVITHFDAILDVTSSSGPLDHITLSQPSNSFSGPEAHPQFSCGPSISGSSRCISERTIEYYVEAGSTPTVTFVAANAFIYPSRATLTGYLIDCTNGCSPIVY